MPEALTESFCERCGTRYEFAAPARLNPLRRTRGVISGLRNYLMSQDALSDAVGDALRSEEDALATHQLEAFHESFNFCIDCRQYTCVNCWNDGAGRCRSCQPIPGTDDLLESFEATFQAQHPELAEQEVQRRLGVEAWPTSDLAEPAVEKNGHLELEWTGAALASQDGSQPEWPTAEPIVAEPVDAAVEAGLDAEPVVAVDVPAPVPVGEVAAAAEVESEPMLPVVHGVAAPEPVEPAFTITWEADAEITLEALPEPEPEPVVAEAPPTEAPKATPVPIRPVSETLLRLPPPQPVAQPAPPAEQPAVAAQADDAEVAARRAKLELLGLGDPGEGPVGQRPTVVPYRSSGAHPVELSAAARSHETGAPGTFWDASAREVAGAASQVGVQACAHCGLSLSATARFCRRCGTRQAQPA